MESLARPRRHLLEAGRLDAWGSCTGHMLQDFGLNCEMSRQCTPRRGDDSENYTRHRLRFVCPSYQMSTLGRSTAARCCTFCGRRPSDTDSALRFLGRRKPKMHRPGFEIAPREQRTVLAERACAVKRLPHPPAWQPAKATGRPYRQLTTRSTDTLSLDHIPLRPNPHQSLLLRNYIHLVNQFGF
jgi:hypothetical protein